VVGSSLTNRDEKEPFGYSTVVFRDPDNVQLKLVAVG
jgi:hypothetical protein